MITLTNDLKLVLNASHTSIVLFSWLAHRFSINITKKYDNLFPVKYDAIEIIYNRMSTPSINVPSTGPETAFQLNLRIKSLENDHKQLQQRLKERVESLTMQINLAQTMSPSTQNCLNNTLVETIAQQHADLHHLCSDHLIRCQVKIQEEAEIKEIIKNYQKRIMDLRSMLVGKEAEIVYDSFQMRRDNIPKRENLQILNNQQAQKLTIRKYLEDLKKIRVEVSALDHAVKMKMAVAMNSIKGLPPAQLSFLSCTNNEDQRASQRLDMVSLKKKTSSYQNEKLISKINQLIMDQMTKQQKLKETLMKSKIQWQNVTKQHQNLSGKYKKLMKEKMKGNKIVATDNLLLQLENQQNQNDEENTKIADLFIPKYQNITKCDSKNPPSKRRNNLRQKRKQWAKEN